MTQTAYILKIDNEDKLFCPIAANYLNCKLCCYFNKKMEYNLEICNELLVSIKVKIDSSEQHKNNCMDFQSIFKMQFMNFSLRVI